MYYLYSPSKWYHHLFGFPDGSVGKESAYNAGDRGDVGLIPGQEDPQRRKWQPTPVFLLKESHGQRSLVGMTEQ